VTTASNWLKEFSYQRDTYTGWTYDSGTSVYVYLFQFVDQKGAAGWLAGTKRSFGAARDLDRGAVFESRQFANWYAFKPANGYTFMAAIAWKDTLGLWIHLRIPGTETNLALLTDLLEDQFLRLPCYQGRQLAGQLRLRPRRAGVHCGHRRVRVVPARYP
jgi:hypothetical protein